MRALLVQYSYFLKFLIFYNLGREVERGKREREIRCLNTWGLFLFYQSPASSLIVSIVTFSLAHVQSILSISSEGRLSESNPERQGDKERDRETERERDRETKRETGGQRERQGDRERERQREKGGERERQREEMIKVSDIDHVYTLSNVHV